MWSTLCCLDGCIAQLTLFTSLYFVEVEVKNWRDKWWMKMHTKRVASCVVDQSSIKCSPVLLWIEDAFFFIYIRDKMKFKSLAMWCSIFISSLKQTPILLCLFFLIFTSLPPADWWGYMCSIETHSTNPALASASLRLSHCRQLQTMCPFVSTHGAIVTQWLAIVVQWREQSFPLV